MQMLWEAETDSNSYCPVIPDENKAEIIVACDLFIDQVNKGS